MTEHAIKHLLLGRVLEVECRTDGPIDPKVLQAARDYDALPYAVRLRDELVRQKGGISYHRSVERKPLDADEATHARRQCIAHIRHARAILAELRRLRAENEARCAAELGLDALPWQHWPEAAE